MYKHGILLKITYIRLLPLKFILLPLAFAMVLCTNAAGLLFEVVHADDMTQESPSKEETMQSMRMQKIRENFLRTQDELKKLEGTYPITQAGKEMQLEDTEESYTKFLDLIVSHMIHKARARNIITYFFDNAIKFYDEGIELKLSRKYFVYSKQYRNVELEECCVKKFKKRDIDAKTMPNEAWLEMTALHEKVYEALYNTLQLPPSSRKIRVIINDYKKTPYAAGGDEIGFPSERAKEEMCAFICNGAVTRVFCEELAHIAEQQNPNLQIGMGQQLELLWRAPGWKENDNTHRHVSTNLLISLIPSAGILVLYGKTVYNSHNSAAVTLGPTGPIQVILASTFGHDAVTKAVKEVFSRIPLTRGSRPNVREFYQQVAQCLPDPQKATKIIQEKFDDNTKVRIAAEKRIEERKRAAENVATK